LALDLTISDDEIKSTICFGTDVRSICSKYKAVCCSEPSFATRRSNASKFGVY
jgi:hypothetical protein